MKDKTYKALSFNNKIPGPTLYAQVGDTLEIEVTNKLSTDTSIHWHGVLLPNEQDGVPYLTTPPIHPGTTYTFKYPIIHAGTYWYHSHSGMQEQLGLYGSLVFTPKEEKYEYDHDYVVVLSDWINENPSVVLSNIKRQDNYYALKKGTVQSWAGVIENGWLAVKARLKSSWNRMETMDISDIGYDAFWANGKVETYLNAEPGETIRVRFVNAGASTYFYLQYAGGPMTVISADGMKVEPLEVNKIKIAVAETYDVLIRLPEEKNTYELRATAEDTTGYSSVMIGSGPSIYAPDVSKPNIYLGHQGSGVEMNHSMHDMSDRVGMENKSLLPSKSRIDLDDFEALRSPVKTTLPKDRPWRIIKLNLTGNMERYVWGFNNRTLSESDNILIRKGENIRIIMHNETMMHHPIHLHGHFFRVLNKQGEFSPLKHTVNVPPMGTVEIEFAADEEKDWFFHCHNLYHMNSGMARVISYEGSTTADRKTISNLAHDTDWFHSVESSVLSNMSYGDIKIFNTRNTFAIEYQYNYQKKYDFDIIYGRNISRYLDIYGGIRSERDGPNKKEETAGIIGIKYVLPLLIESDLFLSDKGHVRLGLRSMLQLTDRSNFSWLWNTDKEYRLSVAYEIQKDFYISGVYDSESNLGIGIKIRF